MSNIVPEDISQWEEGWVYDRTMQAKQRRDCLRWMDSVLGFNTKEDTWNSSP